MYFLVRSSLVFSTGGPRRGDERYGVLAQNPEGDEAFRKDRRAWYQHVTGESLDGNSVTQQ